MSWVSVVLDSVEVQVFDRLAAGQEFEAWLERDVERRLVAVDEQEDATVAAGDGAADVGDDYEIARLNVVGNDVGIVLGWEQPGELVGREIDSSADCNLHNGFDKVIVAGMWRLADSSPEADVVRGAE